MMIKTMPSSTWLALAALAFQPRLGAGELDEPVVFKWENDLEAARRTAFKEGKPLLVVFR